MHDRVATSCPMIMEQNINALYPRPKGQGFTALFDRVLTNLVLVRQRLTAKISGNIIAKAQWLRAVKIKLALMARLERATNWLTASGSTN